MNSLYVTLTQLADVFGVNRASARNWLCRAGLLTPDCRPTEKALKEGVCKPVVAGDVPLFLWEREKAGGAMKLAKCGHPIANADHAFGAWSTPSWLFDLLDAEFHFTLDAAASPHNAKCNKFFTEVDDGMSQSWGRETVWCNPPWSAKVLGMWVRKAWEESRKGATVVMLIPHWKGYEWFDGYCVAQGQIRNIMGKVYFKGANGKAAAKDCVVVVFAQDAKGYTNGPSIRKPKPGNKVCRNSSR